MTRERSAGFVVFRDDKSFTGGRAFLLLDYGKYWDLPKGHLEKGEYDLTAALRELKEETGIRDAQVIPGFAREMTYFFRHKKRGLIRKEVIFFLARTEASKVRISDEHEAAEFLSLEDAIDRATYRNAKELIRAAGELLNRA